MKKALALILALVLALSMAVSAFALSLESVTVLEDEEPEAAKKTLKKLDLDGNTYAVMTDNGGTYYFLLNALNADSVLDDITVTTTGCVEAEMLEFDPELYNSISETYCVLDEDGVAVRSGLTYEVACDKAEKLNEHYEVTYFTVACEQDLYVVKVVIEPNYTTAYKTGKIAIKATNLEYGYDEDGDYVVVEKTPVKANVTVISDVAIFEYEKVKSASKLEKLLKVDEETGYSDYDHSGDYDKEDGKYVASDLRYAKATVISTTAFRALREEIKDGITVKANKTLYVEIPEIAAGQKGVNFVTETAANFFPASDKEEDGVVEVYDYDLYVASKGAIKAPVALAFGFLGDQVVKGEFTVTAKLPYTYFTLREYFEEAVEEDDIVTYYLVKDGKVAQEIVVDYMTADIYDDVVLEIELADTTLGQYEIRVDVEVEAEAGEENPNTGAESVVGVVAALAVVSVATAAAVSLKK